MQKPENKIVNGIEYKTVPEYAMYSCTSCVADEDPQLCNMLSAGDDCNDYNIVWAKVENQQNPQQLTPEYNMVSKPKHYMLIPEKQVEVRDVMQSMAGRLQNNSYSAMFISDYIQMQQYLLRFDEKNKKEDLQKAKWYLDKLITDY